MEIVRYVVIVVVSTAVIATFHAVLTTAMQGDKPMMVLAALFWIVVIGSVTLMDAQRRRGDW